MKDLSDNDRLLLVKIVNIRMKNFESILKKCQFDKKSHK